MESAHTNTHQHNIHSITGRAIKAGFSGWMRSCEYPQKFNHNTVQTCSAEEEKNKKQPNQFPVDVCFLLVMFDLEFTFICSKATKSRCNGCLRHCKPQYLACPRRILPLAESESSLTSQCRSPGWCSARAGWRGRRTDETGPPKFWFDPALLPLLFGA